MSAEPADTVIDQLSKAINELMSIDAKLQAFAESIPGAQAEVAGFIAIGGGTDIPPGSPGPRNPFVPHTPYNPLPARIAGLL